MFTDLINKSEKTAQKKSSTQSSDLVVSDAIKQRTFEILKSDTHDLTWEVEKVQLVPEGNGRQLPESFGLYQGSNWLGTVGPQYEPIQNVELVQILLMAFESVNFSGAINAGQFGYSKVYVQAELEDATVGNDTLKRWLSFLDFKNGGGSLRFGACNRTVKCWNTFQMALRELSASRFKHTGTIIERVKQAAEALAEQIEQEQFLIKNLQTMAASEVDEKQARTIMQDVLPIFGVKDVDLSTTAKFSNSMNTLSTRSQNKVKTILSTMEDEMASHGNNLWGILSGATYVTNHIMTVDSQGRQKHDPLEYTADGLGYRINRGVYDLLEKQISAN